MNSRNRIVGNSGLRTRGQAVFGEYLSPMYRVGELLVEGRTAWCEGAQYHHGRNGHELTIFLNAPDDSTIDAVRRGEAEFALTVAGPVFYLGYRFGDESEWRDVPYAWHLQHPEDRRVPAAPTSPEARSLLWVSLVGANDGVVRAQRGLTLSPEFTRVLHETIRRQMQTPFDPLEHALSVAETCGELPEAGQRISLAAARSIGNS